MHALLIDLGIAVGIASLAYLVYEVRKERVAITRIEKILDTYLTTPSSSRRSVSDLVRAVGEGLTLDVVKKGSPTSSDPGGNERQPPSRISVVTEAWFRYQNSWNRVKDTFSQHDEPRSDILLRVSDVMDPKVLMDRWT
ncbi:MAG: hypothetical protein K6T63_03055, partial [Alicyclobacillus herbarius]|uniref:hypothetical protein n=1 Tax=Alicyclobacillus herbarius TaxID=122960 RepID=UPI002355F691